MQKNTSITLGEHFDKFISSQIESGRYASTSETIRAALRLLEKEEVKLDRLRKSLIDGEQSGRDEYSLESIILELDNE